MRRWEYCEQMGPEESTGPKFIGWLNQLGQHGWELIESDPGGWCLFKRELPSLRPESNEIVPT